MQFMIIEFGSIRMGELVKYKVQLTIIGFKLVNNEVKVMFKEEVRCK